MIHTDVDAPIIYDLSQGAMFTFHTVNVYTPNALAWQQPGLGAACQSGKMATLFFVFQMFASV